MVQPLRPLTNIRPVLNRNTNAGRVVNEGLGRNAEKHHSNDVSVVKLNAYSNSSAYCCSADTLVEKATPAGGEPLVANLEVPWQYSSTFKK